MKLVDYDRLHKEQETVFYKEQTDNDGNIRNYLFVTKYRLFFQTDTIGIQTYDVSDFSDMEINRALEYLKTKEQRIAEINNRISTNAGNEDREDTSREDNQE